MSDYSLTQPAVEFYEQAARAKYGDGFVAATKGQFADLQQKYFSSTENPDYGSDVKKFCYLFKYSVSHGYYIFQALKEVAKAIKPSPFSRNPTRIACIGGGPGTELIGIARYIREKEPDAKPREIKVTIFDKEKSWKAACERILNCVKGDINISFKFVEFDATDPATYSNIDFSKFHFVMANFFLSEIRKAKIVGKTASFWKHLFVSLGDGKVFLAVDFADAGGQAARYIDSIMPPKAIEVVNQPLVKMSCPDHKAAIAELEAEIDHRPKKNADNIVRAFITG